MANTSTPINTVSRDNIIVLIRNNVMNNSLEFVSESDGMDTDSPHRKPTSLKPIIKKLFHSPISPQSPERLRVIERSRKRKRRNILIPDSEERIKMAYVKENEKDGYSPDAYAGMRKRVLISLFHNKEYCMDIENEVNWVVTMYMIKVIDGSYNSDDNKLSINRIQKGRSRCSAVERNAAAFVGDDFGDGDEYKSYDDDSVIINYLSNPDKSNKHPGYIKYRE